MPDAEQGSTAPHAETLVWLIHSRGEQVSAYPAHAAVLAW